MPEIHCVWSFRTSCSCEAGVASGSSETCVASEAGVSSDARQASETCMHQQTQLDMPCIQLLQCLMQYLRVIELTNGFASNTL